MLNGGFILLAVLFQGTEPVNLVCLRLSNGFNNLMQLTEPLIVGFLAFTKDAHHAVEPVDALLAAMSGQFDHFSFKRIREQRRLDLLVIEGHHLRALLRGKFKALSPQTCRGVRHRQADHIRLTVKGKLRMQLNTGIDFFSFIGELLHSCRSVDLGIERRTTGQRPFGDILRA